MKILKRFRKQAIRTTAVLCAGAVVGAVCVDSFAKADNQFNTVQTEAGIIQKVDASLLDTKKESFYDESVIYKLPDTVSMNDQISVIVTMNTDSLMETYLASDSKKLVSYYLDTW